jgi:hypothetical protein
MEDQNEPRKWRGSEESLIPCRCLSGVCIVVGAVHFVACHFKADFVLVTLIAMCFAPWLGHVFESFGKDGLKYRTRQGEVPLGPPEPALPRGQSLNTSVGVDPRPSGAGLGFSADDVATALAAWRNPPFLNFSPEAKKILATFWKYQQKHIPANSTGRWTFVANPSAPDYGEFVRGLGALSFHGLAGLALNGQFALTDSGLDYCRQHAPEISAWPYTYDQFGS